MGTACLFDGIVLFLVDASVMAAETSRVAAGGSRPVALRGIAAPPDVACLLQERGLPVPNGFFSHIISAVRARLTLMLAPAVTSALAGTLLAATLLAARLAMLPARRLQLSHSSAVGDRRESHGTDIGCITSEACSFMAAGTLDSLFERGDRLFTTLQ